LVSWGCFFQIPYHDVLLDFPFKGDEMPLRSMEQAELIAIGTHNGGFLHRLGFLLPLSDGSDHRRSPFDDSAW
jgi:hypothetical protein